MRYSFFFFFFFFFFFARFLPARRDEVPSEHDLAKYQNNLAPFERRKLSVTFERVGSSEQSRPSAATTAENHKHEKHRSFFVLEREQSLLEKAKTKMKSTYYDEEENRKKQDLMHDAFNRARGFGRRMSRRREKASSSKTVDDGVDDSMKENARENETEKNRGEEEDETVKKKNLFRGARTRSLERLEALEDSYQQAMKEYRDGTGGVTLAKLDEIGARYKQASREHHEELERAKRMIAREEIVKKKIEERENMNKDSDDSSTSVVVAVEQQIGEEGEIDLNEEKCRKEFFMQRRGKHNELILLAVGDTRDHRRVTKDPAIAKISTDFVANLAMNFQAMQIEHYIVVASSKELCTTLLNEYPHAFNKYSCGYSSAYTDSVADLEKWNLKKGDMFLLWMQQWLLVSQALDFGYSVMRVDSDVVFLEDPYPILNGPLLSPFRVVAQTDLFAPNTRPQCNRKSDENNLPADHKRLAMHLGGKHGGVKLCDDSVPGALLNIGLIYFRKSQIVPHEDTALAAFFQKLNEKFSTILRGAPTPDANAERLLDQPIFREVFNQFIVGSWKVATGQDLESFYAGQKPPCPHNGCDVAEYIVDKERKSAPLSFCEISRPGSNRKTDDGSDAIIPELVAGAPDWFFGRGCLRGVADGTKTVYSLRETIGKTDKTEHPICLAHEGDSRVMRAPGKASRGGGLVAVHAVYSKAKKRVDAMKALGWWRLDHGGLSSDVITNKPLDETCENNAQNKNGILFTHTYFRQNAENYKAFVCAGRPKLIGGCPCCSGVPEKTHESLKFIEYTPDDRTNVVNNNEKLQRVSHGCGAYDDLNGGWNEFWNK